MSVNIAVLVATVLCWLVAGVFLAFSDLIMRSLRAIPDEAAARAMQSINLVVFRTVFLFSLLAVGIASAGFVLAWFFVDPAWPGGWWLAVGGAIYLAAVILCTVAGNVPMNEKLAEMDPTDPETHRYWAFYAVRWTSLNHVRTAGSLAAALCFSKALFDRLS